MTAVKRGDLAIIHTSSPAGRHEPTRWLNLSVVTSITRAGDVKAVRQITGHGTTAGATKPTSIGRLNPHAMLIIPATQFRVAEALAAIQARHADPKTGGILDYASPVDLLRDLHPWATGPDDCLSRLRSAAHTEIRDNRDQRCAACGVTTYGDGRITTAEDGCPAAFCNPTCPVGVNFTTNYPIGLPVTITAGFAAGSTGRIDAVADAYPSDLDGTAHYAGRSYRLTLYPWGERCLPEEIVAPQDPALADRYATRRETPAG